MKLYWDSILSATLPTDSTPTYALALHTASSDFGLAIDNFQGDRRSQVWDLGRDLSTQLHLYLQEFLSPQTWRDLMFLAVAKGPGGFTGTRLGVVTARTMAQQLNLPLFPISTLAAAAWANRPVYNDFNGETNGEINETSGAIDLAVEMPAQRGEVHTAIYTVYPAAPQLDVRLIEARLIEVKLSDRVQAIDSWRKLLDCWERPYKLIQLEGGLGATAMAVLELAYQEWQKGNFPHWSEAVPFYGQSPVNKPTGLNRNAG